MPVVRKQSEQRCFFLVLNLFTVYRGGPIFFITEKTILFQGSRGGPTFTRGSNFFLGGGGGPIETHISCDFPGGPDPISPSKSALAAHMHS